MANLLYSPEELARAKKNREIVSKGIHNKQYDITVQKSDIRYKVTYNSFSPKKLEEISFEESCEKRN
jgi:hypothetical protein